MKIAIAQFDARLGDIESICSRIKEQARLAISQGSKVLCVPAPLFCGVLPGSLIDNHNFEHDLMGSLLELASVFTEEDLTILVPAIFSLDGAPLFDVVMMKDGRVIPTRTFCMHQRHGSSQDVWAPPIFEVSGMRVAVSFDALRDLSSLPQGCDILIYFQANCFDSEDRASAGVAGLSEGSLLKLVRDRGIWLAAVCPIGGFDESIFTGGSFFLDESGRLINCSPCFEESLLVQDVVRGSLLPEINPSLVPCFSKEEWVWNALQIHLRDALQSFGSNRVILELDGGLSSSLLAALAVDSVGPRNVIGLLFEREGGVTPEQVTKESDRCGLVRDLAANLHIRLIDRSDGSFTTALDRDGAQNDASRSEALAVSALLKDLGSEHRALILSPLTKTDYSLPGDRTDRHCFAHLAPFGDIYLTDLEFLARYRNRVSSIVPLSLVSLTEIETMMSRVLYDAIRGRIEDGDMASRAAGILRSLDASQVDDVFRSAVDHGGTLEDVPLARSNREAVALLLFLMRAGEGLRRRMPPCPIVSPKSYSERLWPVQLAWSDAGRDGQELHSADGFARDEILRFEKKGEQFGNRMREEIAGLIGSILGVSPDQLQSMIEAGHGFSGDIDRLEEAARNLFGSERPQGQLGTGEGHPGMEALSKGMRPSDFPFFSIN